MPAEHPRTGPHQSSSAYNMTLGGAAGIANGHECGQPAPSSRYSRAFAPARCEDSARWRGREPARGNHMGGHWTLLSCPGADCRCFCTLVLNPRRRRRHCRCRSRRCRRGRTPAMLWIISRFFGRASGRYIAVSTWTFAQLPLQVGNRCPRNHAATSKRGSAPAACCSEASMLRMAEGHNSSKPPLEICRSLYHNVLARNPCAAYSSVVFASLPYTIKLLRRASLRDLRQRSEPPRSCWTTQHPPSQ
jgi:hypothetical protein